MNSPKEKPGGVVIAGGFKFVDRQQHLSSKTALPPQDADLLARAQAARAQAEAARLAADQAELAADQAEIKAHRGTVPAATVPRGGVVCSLRARVVRFHAEPRDVVVRVLLTLAVEETAKLSEVGIDARHRISRGLRLLREALRAKGGA
jgi:hypothetical protein